MTFKGRQDFTSTQKRLNAKNWIIGLSFSLVVWVCVCVCVCVRAVPVCSNYPLYRISVHCSVSF